MSGALALLAVPRRDSSQNISADVANLVGNSADALFDFVEVEESISEYWARRALFAEAEAAFDKIGTLVTTVPCFAPETHRGGRRGLLVSGQEGVRAISGRDDGGQRPHRGRIRGDGRPDRGS